jgi:hypothetical protein
LSDGCRIKTKQPHGLVESEDSIARGWIICVEIA